MECGTISRLLTVMMAGVTAGVIRQLVLYAHYFLPQAKTIGALRPPGAVWQPPAC